MEQLLLINSPSIRKYENYFRVTTNQKANVMIQLTLTIIAAVIIYAATKLADN